MADVFKGMASYSLETLHVAVNSAFPDEVRRKRFADYCVFVYFHLAVRVKL